MAVRFCYAKIPHASVWKTELRGPRGRGWGQARAAEVHMVVGRAGGMGWRGWL